jgi:hypothetical protein
MGSNRREASKARVLRQISEAVEAQSVPLSLCLQFEFGLIETVAGDAVSVTLRWPAPAGLELFRSRTLG